MFQNVANVTDFMFDPFNNHRLVVGVLYITVTEPGPRPLLVVA